MGTLNISDIVFVDIEFGNDLTGQLNSPDFKFKTFDAAYQKVDDLGSSRPPYTISLSIGNYEMNLYLYENISIDSTNDNMGILPEIFIPKHEVQWNGVIFNSTRLCIDIDPIEVRESIFIVGSSLIESTCEVHLDNYSQTNLLQDGSIRKIPYQNKQIDPSIGKTIFRSERLFKAAVRPLLFTAIRTLMIYVNSSDIVIKGWPLEYNGPEDDEKIIQFIDCLLDELGAVVFVGAIDGQSVLFYAFDILLALINNYVPSNQNNQTIQDMRLESNIQIPVIINDINFSIEKTQELTTQDNFLYKETTIPTSNIKPVNKFNITSNPITEMLDVRLMDEYLNAQQMVLNRLGDTLEIPKIAIIDSNITYQGNELCVTDNDNNYFINNSNLSGIELNESENDGINTYPILNNLDKSGSNIERGSKFIRYRCIIQDYVHQRTDGEFFFVDASNGNITITIPESIGTIDDLYWNGRTIQYKRVDRTNNRIIIINKRGLINGKGNKIQLNNKNNKCNNKLPYLELIINLEGNIYTNY